MKLGYVLSVDGKEEIIESANKNKVYSTVRKMLKGKKIIYFKYRPLNMSGEAQTEGGTYGFSLQETV